MKNTYLRKIFKYQHSGWKIKRIVIAKQKSSLNETKTNRVKKINFLYYLVKERFMLLHTHVKGKYTMTKNIKQE